MEWKINNTDIHNCCSPIAKEVGRSGPGPDQTPNVVAFVECPSHNLPSQGSSRSNHQNVGCSHWAPGPKTRSPFLNLRTAAAAFHPPIPFSSSSFRRNGVGIGKRQSGGCHTYTAAPLQLSRGRCGCGCGCVYLEQRHLHSMDDGQPQTILISSLFLFLLLIIIPPRRMPTLSLFSYIIYPFQINIKLFKFLPTFYHFLLL